MKLSKTEQIISEILIQELKKAKGKPVKSDVLTSIIQKKLPKNKCRIKESSIPALIRSVCNYHRSASNFPIVAFNKGYAISYNAAQIRKQINALKGRVRKINDAAIGLSYFL